jgi:hypothetical protein
MKFLPASLFGIVLLTGCASADISPEEYAAANCLRDALATAPHISNPIVVETAHSLVVRFEIEYQGGRTEFGALSIQRPNTPYVNFSNSLGGFPTEWRIDELLAKRCPDVRDDTLEY